MYVHDETILYTSVNIDRDWISSHVRCGLNVQPPKDYGGVDEQRVVREVSAEANPSTKAVHEMSFFLGVCWPWSNLTFLVQMACGIEVFSVCAVDIGASVEVPDVWDDGCSGGDEVALIPVILALDMVSDRSPLQPFLRTSMEQCGSPIGP